MGKIRWKSWSVLEFTHKSQDDDFDALKTPYVSEKETV
jgi:hypothetical protein